MAQKQATRVAVPRRVGRCQVHKNLYVLGRVICYVSECPAYASSFPFEVTNSLHYGMLFIVRAGTLLFTGDLNYVMTNWLGVVLHIRNDCEEKDGDDLRPGCEEENE